MKEYKAKRLPSGNYRIQPMIQGKRVSITFDHAPNKREINEAVKAAEQEQRRKMGVSKGCDTFQDAYVIYVGAKENVLSASTLRGYDILFRHIPEEFKAAKVYEIDSLRVQRLINDYSATHSPKTTRNLNGLISTVLKMANPQLVLNVTLPAKQRKAEYIPTESDIRRILDDARGSRYEIVFWLGVLGLRRGEILALSADDLDGNMLTINKAMVEDKARQWHIKPTPKTEASYRKVYLPDNVRDMILERGMVFKGEPKTIYMALIRAQDRLNIPHFSFHKLRHYFASEAHEMGLSDADIMRMGGWATDHLMKSVYRHAMEENVSESQLLYAGKISQLAEARSELKVVVGGRRA